MKLPEGGANVFGILLLHPVFGDLVGNSDAKDAPVGGFKNRSHHPVLIRLRTDLSCQSSFDLIPGIPLKMLAHCY